MFETPLNWPLPDPKAHYGTRAEVVVVTRCAKEEIISFGCTKLSGTRSNSKYRPTFRQEHATPVSISDYFRYALEQVWNTFICDSSYIRNIRAKTNEYKIKEHNSSKY